MNLTPTSVRVEPGAGSVAAARRWIMSACAGIGRPELAECAALGVSELVTNALLHAKPPFVLSLGGTHSHPRVEVADRSTAPPLRRFSDDPLSTTGRGIELVTMCSTMWGVEIDGGGKVVWFEPAAECDAQRNPVYTFHQTAPAVVPEVGQGYPVTVLGVHVPRCQELRSYYREVRRELRLLSMTRDREYPLASHLIGLFARFDEEFPAEALSSLDDAVERGQEHIDLHLTAPRSLAPLIPAIVEVLDLADSFARAQRLLTGLRTSEQAAYCRWFFGEFRRQADGQVPARFEDLGSEQTAS